MDLDNFEDMRVGILGVIFDWFCFIWECEGERMYWILECRGVVWGRG